MKKFGWFLPLLSVGAWELPVCVAGAEEMRLGIRREPGKGGVVLSSAAQPGRYLTLEGGVALDRFVALDMTLGQTPQDWTLAPDPRSPMTLYRLKAFSIHAPDDTDGDGIDDVWELENAMDPLEPGDAHEDPSGSGQTHWQRYQLSGRRFSIPDVMGREVSLFNFGLPTASHEAISREFSVFNGEDFPRSSLQDVLGLEVSVFNFDSIPGGRLAAESREVSVLNLGQDLSIKGAVSREVSVFNGAEPPRSAIREAYTREVSVFNRGAAVSRLEAISREVSVFNDTLNRSTP